MKNPKETNNLKTEYGHISDLGMLFIPKSIQEESKFKFRGHDETISPSCDKLITLTMHTIGDDDYITLKYYKAVTFEEYKAMRENKDYCKNIRVIDEFGKVVLMSRHREELGIEVGNVLEICLVDEETIAIKKKFEIV